MNVILVDEKDEPVGVMEKLEAHRKAVLHRAFSVFIFNSKGELLLQKRAAGKYHSGGLWSNTCCSHPRPGENTLKAAQVRLHQEMGISTALDKAFDFTYRATFDNGLSEYEFDHVFIGSYDGPVHPDMDEVSDYCFKPVREIRESLQSNPGIYSIWFTIAFPIMDDYLSRKNSR